LARVVAADGEKLLDAVDAATDRPERARLPAVLTSRRVWAEQYTDSEVLVSSQREYGVTIVGPVAADPGRQARANAGFDEGSFAVDWGRQVVTCPLGKESISWPPNTYPQNGMAFEARFARKDCTPCPSRSRCTKSEEEPRIIALLPGEQHEALQAARREQGTEGFRSRYAARAGVEGTHDQAIRRCGLRRCRYSLAGPVLPTIAEGDRGGTPR
jgi:transposase